MSRFEIFRAFVPVAVFWLLPIDTARGQDRGSPKPTRPLSQKEASRELQKLEDEDQRDQGASKTIPEREFAARQAVRRDRAMEILKAGLLVSRLDYINAGMLFQHGNRRDDALIAHILAGVALFEGDRSFGPFLTAAALDRDLGEHRMPQLFGTQFADEAGTQLAGSYVPSIGEGIRREFRLDPLSPDLARGGAVKKARKISAEDLAGLQRAAESGRKAREASAPGSSPTGTSASEKDSKERRARVEKVLGLLRDGEIGKAQESFAAASVLQDGERPNDVLLAHVLYLLSAAKGHPDGRRLSAETLDLWLLSTGRAQRFGTQKKAGIPIEPYDRLLPESVRKAYGLAPLGDSGPAEVRKR